MVIPNGNVKISKDGRSVTYQCADKFKLVGSASAECQRNETWSSPLPKCKGTYVCQSLFLAYYVILLTKLTFCECTVPLSQNLIFTRVYTNGAIRIL